MQLDRSFVCGLQSSSVGADDNGVSGELRLHRETSTHLGIMLRLSSSVCPTLHSEVKEVGGAVNVSGESGSDGRLQLLYCFTTMPLYKPNSCSM